MQIRSADLNFRSNLAIFLNNVNQQGMHLDLMSLENLEISEDQHRAKKEHKSCSGLSASTQGVAPKARSCRGRSRLPNRLIDLEHFGPDALDACVFTTDSQDIKYAALSYCWGTSDFPDYVTTLFNFDGKIRVLRYADMPRTIQHAFQICRQLKLRYLWVDAMCIIQDSTTDWHSEASKMAAIYRGSYLTIAADASTSVYGGCFNDRSLNQTEQMYKPVRIDHRLEDGRRSSIFFSPATYQNMAHATIGGSPLSKRGWAFQERALSPRILHYTFAQLFWECCETYEAEDGIRLLDESWGPVRTLCGFVESAAQISNNPQYSRDLLLLRWYRDIAEPYSTRRFTVWSDRSIALTGIVEALGPSINAEYIGGIWMHSLEYGLGWKRNGPLHDIDTGSLNGSSRGATPSGPSFSWISFLGSVCWPIDAKELGKSTSLITLIDYGSGSPFKASSSSDKASPYSPGDDSGWLRLRGRLKPARICISFEDEDILDEIDYGDWLQNALKGRPGDEGVVRGDVALDWCLKVDDVFCVPLHQNKAGVIMALIVERVLLLPGQYAWRRIGLATVTDVPVHWRTGSSHTILLV
ncbi:heterokaryon incompatibility protein-domain-containing protein [Lasiosphaeria ovina]|uniref:Heterokaryon incompatibility protein-domain-containing protein n=1 Tax=Lasiosphaeria ovina TaxID=92902 RepID=A0AAE0N4X0_9PEZI|nr:heterokaryon incompatibility protein-domain-containing protein [Lasiosphaeria ovina]